jgi:hypothetical protein
MVVIVRAFPVSVEDLAQLNRVPSVDELRPACCPLCEQPSREPGGGLQIVGHGMYRRQALGLTSGCRELVIWIRRFLCRACRRTISVLPDSLYPGRWYTAIAILTSLTLALLGGVPAWKIQERFAGRRCRDWKTLERWQQQLLAPLWSWLAGQLGFGEPACDRRGRRSRLQRLLSLHGASGTSPPEKLEDVARALLCETAHTGSVGRDMRRGQPSDLARRRPQQA